MFILPPFSPNIAITLYKLDRIMKKGWGSASGREDVRLDAGEDSYKAMCVLMFSQMLVRFRKQTLNNPSFMEGERCGEIRLLFPLSFFVVLVLDS